MKKLAIHPLLFAIAPIFSLASANSGEFRLAELIVPLVFALFGAGLTFFLVKACMKSKLKAAVVTSLSVFFFFSYGHLIKLITELKLFDMERFRHRYLMLGLVVTILIIAALLIRSKREFVDLNRVLNAFAAAWLIIAVAQTGYGQYVRYSLRAAPAGEIDASRLNNASDKELVEKRDIYYIIFDRYSSSRALKEHLNFDNSGLTDYLSQKGFYVAEDALANYTQTRQSLSSSLSMAYLDTVSRAVFEEKLQDYKVWRFLKSQGYSFYHFGSWWEPTRENRFADYNYPYGQSDPAVATSFALQQLENTPLRLVAQKVSDRVEVGAGQVLLDKLETLGKMGKVEGPKFVFAHMLLPHDPFLFDENGKPLDPKEARETDEEELYVRYIAFTNKKIMELVDKLILDSEKQPIIIIQADEGFTPTRKYVKNPNKGHSLWYGRSKKDLRLHMGILSAYYMPDFDDSKLYKSISPVNSFRLIFNHYFNTDYSLEEDKSYLDDVKNGIFIDITDDVKHPSQTGRSLDK